MDIDQLMKMKYSELQSLAKKMGVKANMKSVKLIEAITSKLKSDVGPNSTDDNSADEEVFHDCTPADNLLSDDKDEKGNEPMKRVRIRKGTYDLETNTQELLEVTESTMKDTGENNPLDVDDKTADAKSMLTAVSEPKNIRAASNGLKRATKNRSNPLQEPSAKTSGKMETQNRVTRKTGIPQMLKSKVKTPNFKRIHQKNFDKMESLTNYVEKKRRRMDEIGSEVKRKETDENEPMGVASTPDVKVHRAEHRSVMKTPHTGVPFIPSVKSTKKINFNFSVVDSNMRRSPRHITSSIGFKSPVFKFKGNHGTNQIPLTASAKKSFDLQAGLVKKPSYKPHSGAIKPLGQDKSNQSSKRHVGKIIKESVKVDDEISIMRKKRQQYVKGVRTNKRFELQMKMRSGVNMK